MPVDQVGSQNKTTVMARFFPIPLVLALAFLTAASVSAGPTPGKTTFYPFQATVQIGDGEGDGTDGTDTFIKVCPWFWIALLLKKSNFDDSKKKMIIIIAIGPILSFLYGLIRQFFAS